MDVSDEQWAVIRSALELWYGAERVAQSMRRGGRPPAEMRRISNGILWYVWTGGPWRHMPREYGARQTTARYLREWIDAGLLARILSLLEEDVRYRLGLGTMDLDDVPIELHRIGRRARDTQTIQVLRRARRIGLYPGNEQLR